MSKKRPMFHKSYGVYKLMSNSKSKLTINKIENYSMCSVCGMVCPAGWLWTGLFVCVRDALRWKTVFTDTITAALILTIYN